MQSLYPFKLKAIFKEKIWGGQKIKTLLDLDYGQLSNCGEAWLVSGVEGNPTVIENGYLAGNELNELVEVFMGDLVGDKVYDRFGDVFPILVKIIDSNDWLSIQVHPDDKLAQERGEGYGKTEMWYVMQADENAQLICGFNREMDTQSYLQHLEAKNIRDIMNYEQVAQGDVFYSPAGRVHALGPGTLIAEIQQTSDTTYRIYDWDRVDASGQGRELHTEAALDAINFERLESYKTSYFISENKTEKIIQSDFFTTNILELSKALRKDYSELDSFVILMCTEGCLDLEWESQSMRIRKGEVVLLPQLVKHIGLHPREKSRLLEVYIS